MSDPEIEFAGNTKWRAIFKETEHCKVRKILSDEDNIMFVEGEHRVVFTKKEWHTLMGLIEYGYPLYLESTNSNSQNSTKTGR